MSRKTRDTDACEDSRGGSRLSRRALLKYGAALGVTLPAGIAGGHVLASSLARPLPLPEFPLCLSAADGAVANAPLKPLKLAWNASAICTAAAPVAKETGLFARAGLDVEFVNFGGSTEQLLEAIATGKADAGIGMALRWLKPLEQGFDVRITTGVHGGCLRLIGSNAAGTTTLASLKGKTIAIADQAGPAKNFFSILLAENGIDPFTEVEWRQYPAEALPLAIQKGEAQALADSDPRTWIFLKDGKGDLVEVATNLTGKYATRSCCVLAIRGSLIRDDRATAAALTKAVVAGGHLVATDPLLAAKIFSSYGGLGSVEDLAAMIKSQDHHHQASGADLKKEIAAYADELKLVQVFRKTTDSQKFAEKVYFDLFSI